MDIRTCIDRYYKDLHQQLTATISDTISLELEEHKKAVLSCLLEQVQSKASTPQTNTVAIYVLHSSEAFPVPRLKEEVSALGIDAMFTDVKEEADVVFVVLSVYTRFDERIYQQLILEAKHMGKPYCLYVVYRAQSESQSQVFRLNTERFIAKSSILAVPPGTPLLFALFIPLENRITDLNQKDRETVANFLRY